MFTAWYEISKCSSGECGQCHGLSVVKADSRLPVTAEGPFESRPVYELSLDCELAIVHVFLGVVRFFSVTIIPPMLHNYLLYTLFLLEGQTDEEMRWIE